MSLSRSLPLSAVSIGAALVLFHAATGTGPMPGAFGALGGPCGITKPADSLWPAAAVCVLKPFLKGVMATSTGMGAAFITLSGAVPPILFAAIEASKHGKALRFLLALMPFIAGVVGNAIGLGIITPLFLVPTALVSLSLGGDAIKPLESPGRHYVHLVEGISTAVSLTGLGLSIFELDSRAWALSEAAFLIVPLAWAIIPLVTPAQPASANVERVKEASSMYRRMGLALLLSRTVGLGLIISGTVMQADKGLADPFVYFMLFDSIGVLLSCWLLVLGTSSSTDDLFKFARRAVTGGTPYATCLHFGDREKVGAAKALKAAKDKKA